MAFREDEIELEICEDNVVWKREDRRGELVYIYERISTR